MKNIAYVQNFFCSLFVFVGIYQGLFCRVCMVCIALRQPQVFVFICFNVKLFFLDYWKLRCSLISFVISIISFLLILFFITSVNIILRHNCISRSYLLKNVDMAHNKACQTYILEKWYIFLMSVFPFSHVIKIYFSHY